MAYSSLPKVTIYLVSRNYGRFAQEAIESVLRQEYPSWELLLFDDGSSDQTSEIFSCYTNDSRIHSFRCESEGLPAIANKAIRSARGEYIIRLDADDIFDENILLLFSSYLDNHPECSLVFSDYYLIDEDGYIISHERRHPIAQQSCVLDVPPNGACCMARKSMLQEVGGYREDLGAQDGYDLWTRIRFNYDVVNVNLPLFFYRRHGENLTNKTCHILSAHRRIKEDAVCFSDIACPPILGIIPCRSSYDFVPSLWRSEIGERSLLEIKINSLIESGIFDKIIIASDDASVLPTVEQYSDSNIVFFKREISDTIRSRSLSVTLKKLLPTYDPNLEMLSVITYLNTPFVQPHTLTESINTLLFNDADAAIAVQEIKDPMYCKSRFGYQRLNQPSLFKTDYDCFYREASVALSMKNSNIRYGSLLGSRVVNYIIPDSEALMLKNSSDLMLANLLNKHA